MAVKLWFYQLELIIGLESKSVLLLGETGREASSEAVSWAAVCTHVLYCGLYSYLVSGLGADSLHGQPVRDQETSPEPLPETN